MITTSGAILKACQQQRDLAIHTLNKIEVLIKGKAVLQMSDHDLLREVLLELRHAKRRITSITPIFGQSPSTDAGSVSPAPAEGPETTPPSVQ